MRVAGNSSATLTTEVVRTLERFMSLRETWNRLIEDAATDHPFISHVWLQTWWECFGCQIGELCLVLVWEDHRLVGAAPMFVRKIWHYGVRVRSLESIHNDHVPRFEFPVSCRHEEVYEHIWREAHRQNSDLIVLKQFVEGSPALRTLRQSATACRWSSGTWPSSRSPYVGLHEGFDKAVTHLSRKQRTNLRKRQAKLRKSGDPVLECLTSQQQVTEGLADGLEIEAAAWKEAAGTAIVSAPEVEKFYLTLASRMAAEGCARLAFLRINDQRISFAYLLDYHDTVFVIKGGYDPAFSKLTPGLSLYDLLLKDACTRKFKEFDLLGDDDAWKLVWTSHTRSHQWVYLYRHNLKGRLSYLLKFRIKPWLVSAVGQVKRLRAVTSAG